MKLLIGYINDFNDIFYSDFLKQIKTEKQNKINKLQKINDKKLSILGEYLLYYGTFNYYKKEYRNINVIYNIYGKPIIKDNLFFYNISHKNNIVICTFSNKRIGCDIEKIKKVNLQSMKYFACKTEQQFIIDNTTYFSIYCLKEAYFKMAGTNLDNILNVFFYKKNNKWYCSDKDVSCKVIIYEQYVIAICQKK